MAGGHVVIVLPMSTQRGTEITAQAATMSNARTVELMAKAVAAGKAAGHQEVWLQLHRLRLPPC